MKSDHSRQKAQPLQRMKQALLRWGRRLFQPFLDDPIQSLAPTCGWPALWERCARTQIKVGKWAFFAQLVAKVFQQLTGSRYVTDGALELVAIKFWNSAVMTALLAIAFQILIKLVVPGPRQSTATGSFGWQKELLEFDSNTNAVSLGAMIGAAPLAIIEQARSSLPLAILMVVAVPILLVCAIFIDASVWWIHEVALNSKQRPALIRHWAVSSRGDLASLTAIVLAAMMISLMATGHR